MKVSIGFNADVPGDEIARYAAEAENLGYECLWMHEHSFGRDAVSNIAQAAVATKRIGLGFGCLSPYTRNPVALAMTSLSLHEVSGGRVRLGIGTGFPARLDLMGIHHEFPISTLKDTIEICRQIWSGSPTNYSGKTFSVRNVKSLFGGAKSKIPIYIAGWKPQMLQLTATYADGYLAKGGESINSIRHIVSDLTSKTSNGRSIEEIDVAAYLLTLVAATKDEAVSKAKRDPFVAYMLSVQDDYLYEGTGIDPVLKKPIAENYFKGNMPGAFALITDEMIEAFTVVGTKSQVSERVAAFKKSGLNHPILQPILMKIDEIKSVMDSGSILIEST